MGFSILMAGYFELHISPSNACAKSLQTYYEVRILEPLLNHHHINHHLRMAACWLSRNIIVGRISGNLHLGSMAHPAIKLGSHYAGAEMHRTGIYIGI